MTRTAFGPPSCLKDDKGLSRRLPMNYSSNGTSFFCKCKDSRPTKCVYIKKEGGGKGA